MTMIDGGRRGWRSVGAVIAGLAFTAVVSMALDALMHATGIFPASGQPMSDTLFVWATVYRCAAAIGGGFVTARLAPGHPMAHVFVLGTLGLLAATGGAIATWNAGPEFGPRWYPIGLVVTALPCVWLGGVLEVRGELKEG